jgi:hypothetical protein
MLNWAIKGRPIIEVSNILTLKAFSNIFSAMNKNNNFNQMMQVGSASPNPQLSPSFTQ